MILELSVQTDNPNLLKDAVSSDCVDVRFGSEFCEWKIPSLPELRKAYDLCSSEKKSFTYVTPRVSNRGLKKIREHLDFLSGKGNVGVVFNDLGVLNILQRYSNLRPHLGRQLVYMPRRCPWLEMGVEDIRYVKRRYPSTASMLLHVRKEMEDIFSQTSLNYEPTIQFFQGCGVKDADVDWLPQSFRHFNFLVERGINLFVHLYLIPVTLTRKCHTARFLGEKIPETCSRPCYTTAFLLKLEELELFLHGNVVFRLMQPSRKDVAKLFKSNFNKFVITMNPVTKILSCKTIDEIITEWTGLVRRFMK